MRSKLIAAGALVAIVVAVILLTSSGGDSGNYTIRAIFDNGGFMVKGEQVRVAGANVGEIKSVTISMPGETTHYENGQPKEDPGKAVIVMEITDPGFQDFRSDGGCQIRPQSLIGEKFVDCRPTVPRAPGSPPAPPLKEIPDGQPGAGQYLLPLGNSGTSVDPDLINDIQSLPYAQRFRLILNELGAAFAGRGEDVEEIVKRANPVLRDVDRLFGILNAQRAELAKLTSDSDEILRPFARERAHVAGFFANAGAAAQASSEKGSSVEASFHKFPQFLREFRQTLHSLQRFSDAATPVFADFDRATPALTDATRTLVPFSAASTVSLKSLGATGEIAGPIFRDADPIVRKSRDLALSGASPTTKLANLLLSTENTGGWDSLLELIYNTNATVNGFDKYGHVARTAVQITNCLEYEIQETSGCSANFNGEFSSTATSSSFNIQQLLQRIDEGLQRENGGAVAPAGGNSTVISPSAPVEPLPSLGSGEQLGAKSLPSAPQRALLDYLLGP